MKTVLANDRMTLSKRTVTADGHLVAPATIARTGIQVYRAYELGLSHLNPMLAVRLYRPPEEVFATDSMSTFEGVPVTNDHPEGNVVHDDNREEVTVGYATGIAQDGDLMTGLLTVTDRKVVDAIAKGKAEISNGYSFSLDMTPGYMPDGTAYDGVQRNIRGNHVAIVDSARCGSACRIADSQPQGAKPMAVRKVTIDGIPFELDEAAAAAVDKLVGDRDALKNRAPTIPAITYKIGDASITVSGDKVVEEFAAKDALIIAKDAEIEALKKDVMTPAARDAMVADWAKTLNEAKRLVPAIATDGKTCLAIRREVLASVSAGDTRAKAVVDAVLGGKGPAEADETSVRAAFNAVAATIEVQSAVDAALDRQTSDALLGKGGKHVNANDAEAGLSGPELLAHRMANAWQTAA